MEDDKAIKDNIEYARFLMNYIYENVDAVEIDKNSMLVSTTKEDKQMIFRIEIIPIKNDESQQKHVL